ncbi:MAG: hypothetical protein II336_20030 [Loktanella sp.]|nr:hypothetical protein [Loktanella sp.]
MVLVVPTMFVMGDSGAVVEPVASTGGDLSVNVATDPAPAERRCTRC